MARCNVGITYIICNAVCRRHFNDRQEYEIPWYCSAQHMYVRVFECVHTQVSELSSEGFVDASKRTCMPILVELHMKLNHFFTNIIKYNSFTEAGS